MMSILAGSFVKIMRYVIESSKVKKMNLSWCIKKPKYI